MISILLYNYIKYNTLDGYITNLTLHIGGAKPDNVVYNLLRNPGIFDEPPVDIIVEHNYYLISLTEVLIISISICYIPLKFSVPVNNLSAISDNYDYGNDISLPSGNSY